MIVRRVRRLVAPCVIYSPIVPESTSSLLLEVPVEAESRLYLLGFGGIFANCTHEHVRGEGGDRVRRRESRTCLH